jgi:hypothetical protein
VTLAGRVIAVLVALRRGPLTVLELRHRISDDLVVDTEHLIVDMARDDAYQGRELIARCHGRWYLTGASVEWLETQGLTCAPEALIGYMLDNGNEVGVLNEDARLSLPPH